MNRPYAEVIGDPIAHSKSPLIYNFWLQKRGIDAEYRACRVRANELADYFTNRRKDPNWRGCNVTIPHKEAVATLIDKLLPSTLEIGAINTVVVDEGELSGANTDVSGVLEPMRRFNNFDQTVAIIGAGGAARAAAAAINSAFPDWPIRFLVKRPAQARVIADRLGIKPDIRPIEDAALAGVTILINASPLGMTGKPTLSLSLEAMRREESAKIIFDMVYAPLETSLLAQARREGFATIDGLQMLVAQAAEAFELFFGVSAPRDHDDELRALLVK